MAIANLPPDTSDSKIVKSFEFPFQRGENSFPKMTDPRRVAYNHIRSLLLTGKNERVMNPIYGVNIHSLIFDNLTPITMARVSSIVARAIETWVPEVQVFRVTPSIDGEQPNMQTRIVLDIEYRVANQPQSAQIPIELAA